MAYVQTDSASGSFLNALGQTVSYTTASNLGNLDPLNFAGLDGPGLGFEGGGSASEIHTRVYSEQVNGAQIQMASFSNNASAVETVTIVLDGLPVNLNDLIAAGQATLSSVENDVVVTPGGALQAVWGETVSSIATLTINVPFSTLGLDMAMSGDGLGIITEVYIDDTAPPPVCFCVGTLIETDHGPRAIEVLKAGDRVRTVDSGYATIHWAGRRAFGSDALSASPFLRPVRIKAGALGMDLPRRDVRVSRQHRVLLSSRIAERMFGTPQVLVPAIKLAVLPGVEIDLAAHSVDYHHLAFDRHEVVFAEGAPMESLLLGPETMKSLPWATRVELGWVFPEVTASISTASARMVPKARRLSQLIRRHAQNARPALEAVHISAPLEGGF